jgi:hypothetical protein
MIKRGLCSACVSDKNCVFPRNSSVWQCEEFSADAPVRPAGARNKKLKPTPRMR